jgi:hypothetical protein
VALPTKLSEAGVGTTVTWYPRSCNLRRRSHDLYAAIPPPTPKIISGPSCDISGPEIKENYAVGSRFSIVNKPSFISRSAIERGFS